jgi:hypothetical protein
MRGVEEIYEKHTYPIKATSKCFMSSSTTDTNELRCNECGITFTTVQDKEQHMKLEHKESKGPAGVK